MNVFVCFVLSKPLVGKTRRCFPVDSFHMLLWNHQLVRSSSSGHTEWHTDGGWVQAPKHQRPLEISGFGKSLSAFRNESLKNPTGYGGKAELVKKNETHGELTFPRTNWFKSVLQHVWFLETARKLQVHVFFIALKKWGYGYLWVLTDLVIFFWVGDDQAPWAPPCLKGHWM